MAYRCVFQIAVIVPTLPKAVMVNMSVRCAIHNALVALDHPTLTVYIAAVWITQQMEVVNVLKHVQTIFLNLLGPVIHAMTNALVAVDPWVGIAQHVWETPSKSVLELWSACLDVHLALTLMLHLNNVNWRSKFRSVPQEWKSVTRHAYS